MEARRRQSSGVGYNGNNSIKRDGVEQSFSEDEIREYRKCMASPEYFATKYMKVIHLEKGIVPFDLYPYQRKMFKQFQENRFNIVLACRQSGKSISMCAYLLWYALFHSEKSIAILANKGATAKEMLSRITLALENIPFFLQPGCKIVNKHKIEFSNNSYIIASATSGNSIRGLSINLLALDEFAFVENANTFYTSTYPVISSGKNTKVIVTSTANGVGNLFYRLWEGAVQETNNFKPFRVDWWDVPGRDEKWKEETVANTSQKQFDQEYGNHFSGTTDTLIESDCLLGLKSSKVSHEKENVRFYEKPEEGHQYVMTVDVSRGRGQDYSTFNVIDVTERPFRQVCVYQDNMISPLLFPDIIVKIAKAYNEALVVIESNDAGQVVCNSVYYEFEYENCFVESTVKKGGIGVSMTKKIKRVGCSNLKDLVERGQIKLVDAETIVELSSFEFKGASYAAAEGFHDDLVMNLVLFSWFVSSDAFGDLIGTVNLKKMLYDEKVRQFEHDLVPPGFFGSGSSGALSDEMQTQIQQKKDWLRF